MQGSAMRSIERALSALGAILLFLFLVWFGFATGIWRIGVERFMGMFG